MNERSCLSVILAAGEGTRMKSAIPKVLHRIAGLEMVGHVMASARAAGGGDLALVVGHAADAVRAAAGRLAPGVETFEQRAQRGTADAVLAAREAIARGYDDVLVMFGDTPLIQPETLMDLRATLESGAEVAVLGFRTERPHGYGRLIEEGDRLVAIREEADCSDEERTITLCNSGLMAIAGDKALGLLDAIGNDNAKGEFYLTDIVAIANNAGLSVTAVEAAEENALGINNRAELARAEAMWQARTRHRMMLDGVTMIAPETVFFSHDTAVGPDTVIEPNVFFGPGVRVGPGSTIHANCHFEGAQIASGAVVGPFARLRPGAQVGEKAKVGNFCELKNARLGEGAKVPHLTYLGDAEVGAGANVGAGTIVCNYDGFKKQRTRIGPGAFIGSNSSLVAPLEIGAGAYVASGSVITDDVPDDALALGRARQVTKEGRAKELRERLRPRADKSS